MKHRDVGSAIARRALRRRARVSKIERQPAAVVERCATRQQRLTVLSQQPPLSEAPAQDRLRTREEESAADHG